MTVNSARLANTGVSYTAAGEATVRVYPNPTHSILFIESKAPVNVTVTDITGRVLIHSTQETFVDMSALVNGLYIVHIYNQEGALIRVEKVVKEGN
jgi:hypothetical protein